jgi:hypothetical protein
VPIADNGKGSPLVDAGSFFAKRLILETLPHSDVPDRVAMLRP